MAAFAAYSIIDTVFLSVLPQRRLPIFMGMILLIGFLTFPAKRVTDGSITYLGMIF